MSDDKFDDPSLQTALRSYFFADNAPGLAQALREHAACVRAAFVATRKLIAAVEKWSGPIVFSAEIRRSYPELLRDHQETWAAACKLTLPSRHEAQVMFMLKGIWCKVFLRILLDRMSLISHVTQFENILFIRIFGSVSSNIRNGEFEVTDKESTVVINISDTPGQSLLSSPALPDLSLNLLADIINIQLQAVPAIVEGRPLVVSSEPRSLYSYGPIDVNDFEIKVEAIREFAAALELVEDFMLSAARFFNNRIRDKTSTWDFIIRNNISPTVFTRAANQHRRVELHAIEVALSRHRRTVAGTAPSTSTRSYANAKKKNRKAEKSDLNEAPPSKKVQQPRRGKSTP